MVQVLMLIVLLLWINVNQNRGQDVEWPISCTTGYIEPKTKIKRSNLTDCFFPSSENELQQFILDIVNGNNTETTTIRAIGASISYSANGMIDEYNIDAQKRYDNVIAVNMSNMNQILDINLTTNTITVESGAKVIDVLEALESYNASLRHTDGPTFANIVGWFMGGTCGESGYYSNITATSCMANNVVGLRMITGNGSIVEMNLNDNDDLLNAALISFGSLGIITQVKMSFIPVLNYFTNQPSKAINVSVSNLTALDNAIRNFVMPAINENVTMSFSVSLFGDKLSYRLEEYIGNHLDYDLTNATYRCWREGANGTIIRNEFVPCSDVYYKVKMPPPTQGVGGVSLPTEYFVKEEHAIDVYLEIVSYFLEQKRLNSKLWQETYKIYQIDNKWDLTFGYKLVNGDDENHNIWLSPGYNESAMSMVAFGFHRTFPVELQREWASNIYVLLNDKFLDVTPIRSNWAKLSLSEYCLLEQSYPKLNEFKRLREEFDPYNLFLNSFTRDKLGICEDKCCCTEYSCNMDVIQGEEEKNEWQIILIYSGVGLAVVIVIVVSVCYVVKRRKQRNIAQNEMSTLLT